MNHCLCSHDELEHPGGECIHRSCGCITFRADPAREDAPREEAS